MLTTSGFGGKVAVLSTLLLSSLHSLVNAQNVTSSSKVLFPGSSNVTVAVNVPEGAGKQDLYFHVEAPAQGHTWVGLGLGSQMTGSLMFVMYRSEGNVGEPIVSPRIGFGHQMPQMTSDSNVTVLSTSKVTGDRFLVDFHCMNCRQWSKGGGSIDVTSTSQNFFFAAGPDGTLETNDPNSRISQHGDTPQIFGLNLKAATGASGVPVVGSSSNTDSGGQSGDATDGADIGPGFSSRGVFIHAFVMGLAFSIIYPLGYLFLRLFDRLWLHWGVQTIGVFFTILGVASGIAVSIKDNVSPKLTHPHQIIGLITFFIVLAAWTLGLIGHMIYKRKGVPSPLMKGHRIAGPLAIVLGFVNACIGLNWAGRTFAIAGYAIWDLLIWIVIIGLVFWKKKRNMRKNAANSAAAYNFREGQMYDPPPHPPAYQGVPMDNLNARPIEYYSVQPNKP